MKPFNIYKHPTLGSEAVKVGFSWPAFFFGWLWMLFCKLWGKAALWIGLYVVGTFAEAVADTAADSAAGIIYLLLVGMYLALWLVPAFQGNAWRTENLRRRGYERVTTLQAESKDAAIAQAVDHAVASQGA